MAFDGYRSGSFDNASSSSALSHGIGTGSFTWAAWARLRIAPSSGTRTIWSNGNLLDSFCIQSTSYTSAAWGYYDGAVRAFDTTLTQDAWTHLALVRSGTAVTGYVNGVAEASTFTSTTSLGNKVQRIGSLESSTYSGACELAMMCLWTVSLTAGEVAGLAAGWHPRCVRTADVRAAMWSLGGFEGESLAVEARNLTMSAASGSPTFVDQSRIIYPQGPLDVQLASSSPPAATPWLYARRSARIIGGGLS